MSVRSLRDAIPGLGRASRTETAQQVIRGARRSAVLRRPGPFVAHEILATPGRLGRHELVDGGVAVLRHRTRDVDIFDEILVPPCAYDPPPGAAERLASITRPRIVDVGGNVGLFAVDCLRRYPNATVISVEPDPANLPVLNACRAQNASAAWTIVPAAAGAKAAAVRFNAGNFADSAVSIDGPVEVPMIDVFPLLADADFVKIDIEGGEWPILLDERFGDARAPVVVMEWHAAQAPANREARSLVLDIFATAGYEAVAEGDNHHGVLWGWR